MAVTAVDLANRALVMIGAAPIASFSESNDAAVAANTLYPAAVETLLSRYKWRFASAQVQLSRLAAAPSHKWDAAYSLPSGDIAVHSVFVNDIPIDYEIYEDKVLCNATSSDVVYCDYTFEPDVSKFPAYFRSALVYELAKIFALAVANDPDMSLRMGEPAQLEYVRAIHTDSANQTHRRINTNRFSSFRGSSRK